MMRRLLVPGIVAVAFGVFGCGGGNDSPDTVANAGPPSPIKVELPPGDEGGKRVVRQSGCLACHKIGEQRQGRLGPNLTHIGARESRRSILRTLKAGPGIMPSFENLGEKQLDEVASYPRPPELTGPAGLRRSDASRSGAPIRLPETRERRFPAATTG
jgi:mono/diheme cytochrome c family protein